MNESVEVIKVSFNPGDKGSTQIHDFTPGDQKRRVSEGRLIAVISISAQNPLVREAITRLHEEYFGSFTGNIFTSITSATEKVFQEFTSSGVSIEIASLVLSTNTFYSACAGGAKLLIFRNNKLTSLLASSDKPISGSGYTRADDKLILGTSELFKKIDTSILSALLPQNPQEVKEELISLIHKESISGLEGLALIDFNSSSHSLPSPVKEVKKHKTLRQSAAFFIDRLIALIPEKKITIQPTTVDIETKRKKKTVPLVGFILLILLATSIFFGITQKRKKDVRSQYEPLLLEAIHNFDEAKSLKEFDANRARDLALKARDVALKLKAQEINDARLNTLVESLSSELGNLTGVYETAPDLFLDLSLITNEFQGSDMALSGELILVLDSNKKKLVGINISSKKTKIISGPDFFPNTLQVTGYAETSYILSNDGIRETTNDIELQIKPENWNPDKVLVSAFAGNMYVLEKTEEGVIWRYPGIRSGFAEPANWFGSGVAPNLSNAISMSVDGSIWVLTSSGKILKYNQGSPKTFTPPKNISLSKATHLFTNDESKFLYILFPTTQKILVLSKEGDYVAEYTSEEINKTTKIVVSEAEKKLILLTGSKLLSINLEHM